MATHRQIPGVLKAAAIGLLLLAFPAFYIASIGPAGRAVVRGGMGYETWASAYRPILWTADNSMPVDRNLTSYLSWWGGLPFQWAWRDAVPSEIAVPSDLLE